MCYKFTLVVHDLYSFLALINLSIQAPMNLNLWNFFLMLVQTHLHRKEWWIKIFFTDFCIEKSTILISWAYVFFKTKFSDQLESILASNAAWDEIKCQTFDIDQDFAKNRQDSDQLNQFSLKIEFMENI